ncbi:DUF3488 and transglutaminase-like domain-containing protein [Catellatospora sp. KI3]|uniref:DUF3488 and transglutaminase-like domain-containing protein n=1 Tax=Catellatospora sp. KI3 TaxID=3041620 RepID=UPI0024824808|nr:DUF3488 and transglutaminase-like domain-containing protein [Catellatospora sp. KI3]MDI1462812.1 DUF3488 and transglutaminase-like domain-containing protein [Catellatospora sp. KI3]
MVIRALRALTLPLLILAMLVLAGTVAGRIYSGTLFLQLVAGAAAGSVLVSVACTRLRAWLVAPLSVLALAGYLAYALHLSAQRAGVDGPLAQLAADALRDGIPRLIAVLLPVEPQPDTIAVPVVATWLAGLAATELATRTRRTLIGLAPPVLLFAAALWLVGPAAPRLTWPVLAFASLAVAALVFTGRVRTPDTGIDTATRRALRVRTALAGAVGLLLIVGLTAALEQPVARQVTTAPLDPRSLIDPPDLDALDENPLIRLSGWALQPQQQLLDVQTDHDARIRLAVLSDYDGVTWRVGATYRPAGRTLPQPPEAGRPATGPQAVHQTITVSGLTGKLLPAAATARRVDGVRVSYDQLTGTLLYPAGLTPGTSYSVVSQHTEPDVNLLPGAEVPTGTQMARYLALGPGVPDHLSRLAQQLGADNGAPYQRALAIEQFLADHYRLDPQAPSGHAYPNLDFFLFGPDNGGGRRGTSEQFAATYAVLARLLNLPSRVVVGFQAHAGQRALTAGDALAWPEVYFTDLGWVPFHPLPQPNQDVKPLENEFKPLPETSSPPPQSPEPVPTYDSSEAPTETAGPSTGAGAAGVPVGLIAGAGGGGLLLLLLTGFIAFVLLARAALRRRRLDQGTPGERIAGAWLEVGDALRLAGHPAGGHLSAAEVAAHAADAAALVRGKHTVRLRAPALDDMAGTVNTSVFGPGTADEAQAEAARSGALAYIGELKARRSWWRRLLWTVHPGPLRWYRRR